MQETSAFKQAWRRFARNKVAILGLVILLIIGLLTIFAPLITKYTVGWGPNEIELRYVLSPPSARHPLGTDSVGRDTLTRLLYGGRVSLSIALVTVLANCLIGIVAGAVAGYFGGWVDNVLMRLVDVILSFPFLPFALTLVAIRGPGIENLVFAIVLLGWPGPARLVRGEFLSLRERDFVEAARATGAKPWRIMMRHILPNTLGPLIVSATLGIAGIILLEAGLSFLGFGVRQPVATWGNMLTEANDLVTLTSRQWLWIPPGLMVFLTVLCINFVGDGLRDVFDPRQKR